MQNEPKSFKKIPWETNINTLKDMAPLYKEESELYVRKTDSLYIGDAVCDQIVYQFCKGKFCGVIIEYTGLANFALLQELLVEIHGEPDDIDILKNITYYWHGKSVGFALFYNKKKEKGSLIYQYKPLTASQTKKQNPQTSSKYKTLY
jgi:hypothetical protein